MRRQFSLFQSHLDLAHSYWARLVRPGDTVIDATCGNGHDTLQLAQLVGAKGVVYAYDIQEQAIAQSKTLLEKHEVAGRIRWSCQSHEDFGQIPPTRLIVFNLGYLPGSDKTLTTLTISTLASIRRGMDILMAGGAMSITAYPGHPEGANEEAALWLFLKELSPLKWNSTYHQWPNRKKAPSLFFLQKARC